MNKELQDLAWAALPKEFREEVKKYYRTLHEQYKEYDGLHFETAIAKVQERIVTLEYFFGGHNLTSDAEGEEMLAISRREIQQLVAANDKLIKKRPGRDSIEAIQAKTVNTILNRLFGSKCLPDELANEDNFATKEPKPAEPKFIVGEKVIHKGVLRVIDLIDTATHRYHLSNGRYYAEWVDESDLEPYTEPEDESRNLSQETANCDKEFDTILKGGFREHNRLQIAAMAMQGLMCNPYGFTLDGEDQDKTPENVAEMAFLCADALIARAEKGGDE